MQNIRACASIRNPTCAHPCRRCPGQTVVGCRRCGRHQSTCSSKKLHLEARASHSTSFGPVSSAQTHALSAEDLDGTISHSKQLQGQAQSSCRADQGSTIYLSSAPGLVGGILWGHPHDLAVMASVFSLHAATVVFICYMCSWLVYSDKPALSKHPLVAQLNNMRKASCKALQASHGVCALAAVTAVALDPASIAQLVPHLSGGSGSVASPARLNPIVVAATLLTWF
ncbi:hypothetical protein DUNSADRAFT_2151 [Dunaliella salina]|uniref:Encoded protein n=1 Tax=Dunaliella salina TaxID=3046 RepID=A0ABQ7H8D2_DUNSA|nr:hypothetical protein DUNSADRAFT_2151 [Dunaliella salina]|eukprot:KAF5843115.1 hypothetical protein DUNSADRAFT_2151 [Dunaliella salina]